MNAGLTGKFGGVPAFIYDLELYVGRPSTGVKAKKKKRKSMSDGSRKSSERVEEDVPSKDLEIAYIIWPGTLWESMRQYHKFVGEPSFQHGEPRRLLLIFIVGEEIFGVNDFISFLRFGLKRLAQRLPASILDVLEEGASNGSAKLSWER